MPPTKTIFRLIELYSHYITTTIGSQYCEGLLGHLFYTVSFVSFLQKMRQWLWDRKVPDRHAQPKTRFQKVSDQRSLFFYTKKSRWANHTACGVSDQKYNGHRIGKASLQPQIVYCSPVGETSRRRNNLVGLGENEMRSSKTPMKTPMVVIVPW